MVKINVLRPVDELYLLGMTHREQFSPVNGLVAVLCFLVSRGFICVNGDTLELTDHGESFLVLKDESLHDYELEILSAVKNDSYLSLTDTYEPIFSRRQLIAQGSACYLPYLRGVWSLLPFAKYLRYPALSAEGEKASIKLMNERYFLSSMDRASQLLRLDRLSVFPSLSAGRGENDVGQDTLDVIVNYVMGAVIAVAQMFIYDERSSYPPLPADKMPKNIS